MNDSPRLPANASEFDFSRPDPMLALRQRRGRQMGLLMALLLIAILGHGVMQRDAEYTAAEAKRIERIEEALQDTKPIYGDRAENGQFSLNRVVTGKAIKPGSAYQEEVARTLKEWREITERKGAHPSDWRRWGLVQAVFGQQAALQTFQSLPMLYAQHKPAPKSKTKSAQPDAKTKKKETENEETNLAYIWTPKVPPAQEAALWAAIYGKGPIDAKQVPALATQVKSLELQWFEPVALSDLYAKANLPADSRRASEAALASVRYFVFFNNIETAVRLLSLPAVFLFFGWFLRKRSLNPPAAPAMPAYGGYPVGREAQLYNVPPPKVPNAFSYHARMVAFVSYMALPLILFLPLALFRGQIHKLSSDALGRLEACLEIGGSLLTAFIAVLILRRVDASDRLADENPALRPPFRDTLYQLGYRSRNVPGDVAAGLVGYPALFVPLVIAGLVSMKLFSHFETPPHPVLMSIAALHTPFDRALLLIESAVAPPLVEELMFRGLLYPALRERWGVAGGVILSAAVFALVHPTLPGGFLPLWAMGAIWAFTFERRNSLLPGILMHALNNGLLIALEMAALSN